MGIVPSFVGLTLAVIRSLSTTGKCIAALRSSGTGVGSEVDLDIVDGSEDDLDIEDDVPESVEPPAKDSVSEASDRLQLDPVRDLCFLRRCDFLSASSLACLLRAPVRKALSSFSMRCAH